MTVYPAINCKDAECVKERLLKAKEFLPEGSWIHIDISDPEYSNIESFFDEEVFKEWASYFKFEGHLMIPRERLLEEKWFSGVLKRILVHADQVDDWDALLDRARSADVEVGVAVSPKESDVRIPEAVSIIEVLAVPPGPSGQSFDTDALSTLSQLRRAYPRATLLVDGGVDENTGLLSKQARADVLVSGSYIWNSSDPPVAYQTLASI